MQAAMEGELGRALGSYNLLGKLRAARRIKRGFVNDNWAVETAQGNYFLKRRHPHLRRPDLIPAILRTTLTDLSEAWGLDRDPNLAQIAGQLEAHALDLAARLAGRSALPHLVIHGDYYGGNLLFDGDRIVGVVDYDKARWQPRVVELAEALIYFTTERPGHLKHIVYSGTLDLGVIHQFLAAYTDMVSLSEPEIHALPHLIRMIWLCASLNPPLEPLMSPEAAPQAVPEVLALAGWAQTHASDIVEIGLAAQKNPRG